MARFALTIVRHGETRYNKEKLLQGQGIDEPLSEIGLKQADAAGRFLSNVNFTHVFSSDLTRAKQTTSNILKNNIHCKDITITYDARLRERKYGTAEGRPLSNLKAMAKEAGEQCPSYTPPGGETLDEVRARAKDFFEFLCHMVMEESGLKDDSGKTKVTSTDMAPFSNHCIESDTCSDDIRDLPLDANILLVSHGAYMRNWVKYFIDDLQLTFPPDLKKSRELSVSPNTGISHFIVSFESGETSKPQISCICINRHDHLADIRAGTSQ
ncbi:fructose-2,6-bisphosphatase TIGAR [Bombina bombina]|uniref:fructose-2,6-bisphosphatase TIGAR n=1 Tax=Bombina bombina TaxID=8345 RepID=UPI00235ACB45|nr:fructose-2,6-bisphosphatase TIGAR [Bombina bombina]